VSQAIANPTDVLRQRARDAGDEEFLFFEDQRLPGRRDELRSLAKDYGLAEIFDEEVPAILRDMAEAAGDGAGS
jgi:hypothetical protein